jgi:hypothetical protein
MRVAAIARSLSELKSACSTALSKLASDGHEVHVIIVSNGTAAQKEITGVDNIDYSRIHFVQGFDYSAITQANANKINAFIKTINPTVVLMPHWKSTSPELMILARTSLVACRGIGSILMYEPNDNSNFMPTILFPDRKTSLDNGERYESHRLLLLDEVEMV